ncbi:MAG TPA: NAD-dependent epimerase/dehydratase family protein [Vicinamibacterales bacterium]|nr:NAD-dependent epimerase/dehydratase family protein [Vicinamibacterales bacterium]
MTCLVIGGAGFIGRSVARELAAQGVPPIVADLVTTDAAPFRTIDLRRQQTIREALSGVDCVVHLAWSAVPASATARPRQDVRQNVLGSLRLFSQCGEAGVRRVVFVSSGGAVYGAPRALPISEDHPTVPISSYGVTKLASEAYLRILASSHDFEYVILRPANAYGEGQPSRQQQGLVAACLKAALEGHVLEIWGDGSVVRDYVHVDDIGRATAMAVIGRTAGHTLNIGTGVGHSVNAIVALVRSITGREVHVRRLPARSFDPHDNVLDCREAERRLGWRASISLAEGIERQWRALLAESSGGA